MKPYDTRQPLVQRIERLEQDNARLRRRVQIQVGLALVTLLGTLLLSLVDRPAVAQTGNNGIPDKVAALQAAVRDLQAAVAALQTSASTEAARAKAAEAALQANLDAETNRAKAAESALTADVTALQSLTAPLSLSGADLTITGVNVHIVSGSGRTDDYVGSGGTLTGLGNLIVGYQGEDSVYPATGSHNLVLGDHNGYASYGGLVVGQGNQILGPYCTITGGTGNTARNYWSSVNGGFSNVASGQGSVVSGGQQNAARESYAAVSGGYLNDVTAFRGWAGGTYHSP
jgi:hypothetical protein